VVDLSQAERLAGCQAPDKSPKLTACMGCSVPVAKYLLVIVHPQAGRNRFVTPWSELLTETTPFDLAHEVGHNRLR
jgi:hypothetical protein